MRVALISDLHGNMVALRAVIEHIERSPVDRIVCLGDVATLGPAPQRVVETLADLGCPCILGNHDEFLLDAELIHSYTEIPMPIVHTIRLSLFGDRFWHQWAVRRRHAPARRSPADASGPGVRQTPPMPIVTIETPRGLSPGAKRQMFDAVDIGFDIRV